MELPDEAVVRSAIKSPEYQAVATHRDNAFEHLNIILAATQPLTA